MERLYFDGAMGTYFSQRNPDFGPCEKANLTRPDEVLAIHREYVKAGCNALKTNTFSALRSCFNAGVCREMIQHACRIARSAGAKYVFADLGPAESYQDYKYSVDYFLGEGMKYFLFETLSSPEFIPEIAEYIKSKVPDGYIIVSFAVQPDGFTRKGLYATELLRQLPDAVDSVGLNCICGARHMAALVEQLLPLDRPLSVMPNAGYPTVMGNRTFYRNDPKYFASQMAMLKAMGAHFLGGCCGTTPTHMKMAIEAMESDSAAPVTVPVAKKPLEIKENPLLTALKNTEEKPFFVELDSPEIADITKFMSGAKELRDAGVAAITIADCPIARARMDSSIMACKIRQELGVEALPHMTCRDRNLNATKALLLGLCVNDVHQVLTVTGDPIPSAARDEVKSVYNFNSRMLAKFISGLNETLPQPFLIFGALNVNAPNFHVQLELAKQKEENGVMGFLTQPVLTEKALQNLKEARSVLRGRIFGGIIPVVSHRNACFMNSEVAGITVDDQIVSMYEGLDRAQGEALAVKISAAIAREIEPYIDGYYLMTPFGRTNLMVRIMEEIRKNK